MKVGIFGKSYAEQHRSYIKQLFDKLGQMDAEVTVYEDYYELIKDSISGTSIKGIFSSYEDIQNNLDFLFSIGGDGTLLEASRLIRNSGIPILGINTGRLGFLSSISKEDIADCLRNLSGGKYSLDKRSLLQLTTEGNLFDGLNYALNELTVQKKDTASMISIQAYLDGTFLNTYWADGLIIATPTGSTAYSLSCGGPIITPESENFIITPIAPHNLNVRPVVVPDKSEITLQVSGRADQFLVALDSRTEDIDPSVELKIKKADFYINLLRMENQSFLTTLRNKLMWGMDKRNY